MSDYTPVSEGRYGPFCSANVTGGQLVENTGNNTVGPAAVTSAKVVGVAAQDQVTGGQVTVHALSGRVHETLAGTGGLTAGNPVKAGAAGTVVLYVVGTDAINTFLGICTVGATAGNLARWIRP